MRAIIAGWVAVVAVPGFALADCALAPPPDVARQQAAAVFVGRVLSASRQGDWHVYEFDVEFAWKGITRRRVVVRSDEPGCARGCYFEVGRTFLVYAQSGLDGLTAHNCSRTTELSLAWEDLDALGRPTTTFPVEPATPSLLAPSLIFASGLVVGVLAVTTVRYLRSRRAKRLTSPPA